MSHTSKKINSEGFEYEPACVIPNSRTHTFITQAQETWGDRWDYSETVYINAKTNLSIRCSKHGEYWQRPSKHIEGQLGCKECRLENTNFFGRAKEVWGDRWDYSESIYRGTAKPLDVICREHGKFTYGTAQKHLMGRNACPMCNNPRLGTDEFLKRARAIWGDRWDYGNIRINILSDKVTIGCRLHGEFQQTGSDHLAGGVGCRQCSPLTPKMDLDTFLHRAKEVWGDKWDYSHTSEYLTYPDKMCFVCPKHGEFLQNSQSHLQGRVGCLPCRVKYVDPESFEGRSREVWGDRWDYSKAVYVDALTPIEIVCLTHGPFWQTSSGHWAGKVGCTQCGASQESKPELDLYELVCQLVGRDRVTHRDRSIKGVTEIDVAVPHLRIGFEFNGLYFHSDKTKPKNYHYNKYVAAKEAGFKLIQIFEDDWYYRRAVVESHIRRVLGVSDEERYSARNLGVSFIDESSAKDFLERHHIQGAASSSYRVGLHSGDTLVAVATFLKSGENFTLTRYATSGVVRGGHSKCVAFFEREVQYEELVTFADLTFGDGELYRVTGWKQDSILKPDYMYVRGKKRYHKFNYRLKRFKNDPSLQYVDGYTERSLAEINGLLRIYDAGKIRFVKPHP